MHFEIFADVKLNHARGLNPSILSGILIVYVKRNALSSPTETIEPKQIWLAPIL
jgi:hypothetical protein